MLTGIAFLLIFSELVTLLMKCSPTINTINYLINTIKTLVVVKANHTKSIKWIWFFQLGIELIFCMLRYAM